VSKPLSLIFYGEDLDAARMLVQLIRDSGGAAHLRHAYAFVAMEKEAAARVFLMPDVSEYDATRIAAFYGEIVQPAPADVLPPLPPPPVANPLDNLPSNWRTLDAASLKKLAESISGGRAAENKDQAVQIIDAALRARAAQ
jgi:hypothetical protein